jgi:formylglycine-generating enzyme required for sulfatase activity
MPSKPILKALLCAALAGAALSAHARTPSTKDMVLIPAGEFTMGSDRQEDSSKEREANALNPFGFRDKLYVDEHPAHKVNLPAYWMDKYEVTNAKYKEFVIATHRPLPSTWQKNGYNFSDQYLASLPAPFLREISGIRFNLDMDVSKMDHDALLSELLKLQRARDNMPVVTVTWEDANAYCSWAGKHLATEAEWEKAAKGPNEFEFPWGNNWDVSKIVTMAENQDAPYSAVGTNPNDKSGYGVYDMASNVSEWVADWYDAYPGAEASGIKDFGKTQKVARGGMTGSGHYDSISLMFRTSRRAHWTPDNALIDLGFRCAMDAKLRAHPKKPRK